MKIFDWNVAHDGPVIEALVRSPRRPEALAGGSKTGLRLRRVRNRGDALFETEYVIGVVFRLDLAEPVDIWVPNSPCPSSHFQR